MHVPKQSCTCWLLLKAAAVCILQALVPAKPSGVRGVLLLHWSPLYPNSTKLKTTESCILCKLSRAVLSMNKPLSQQSESACDLVRPPWYHIGTSAFRPHPLLPVTASWKPHLISCIETRSLLAVMAISFSSLLLNKSLGTHSPLLSQFRD